MHRRLVSYALVAALVLIAVPAFANHGWSTYHWSRTTSQVSPKVTMNIGAAWQPYASRVMTDWNASTVIESPWAYGAISTTKRCTSATGQIEVCNNTYGQVGWLGIAGISLSGGHIVKGYVKLNDTYYASAQYNTPAWRRMVFCQEVGHTYGLGHVNETFTDPNTGSCMDYTNDPSGTKGTNGTASNEYPNSHDYNQLLTQYNHTDLVSLPFDEMVKDATRPTTVEEFLNKADQWGEPIAFDADGRPTTFFLKTGTNHGTDGEVIDGNIIDVFWAPIDPFTDDRADRDRKN
ncbi:MAG TPA: hypothetical protein VND45_06020 [Thermoanaerobaculia bacterium]|jgi:hypothetical protein|nr:hypothetical protein [Thermoanaerobaculia bacterium]